MDLCKRRRFRLRCSCETIKTVSGERRVVMYSIASKWQGGLYKGLKPKGHKEGCFRPFGRRGLGGQRVSFPPSCCSTCGRRVRLSMKCAFQSQSTESQSGSSIGPVCRS
eukprot:EG_transcript_60287